MQRREATRLPGRWAGNAVDPSGKVVQRAGTLLALALLLQVGDFAAAQPLDLSVEARAKAIAVCAETPEADVVTVIVDVGLTVANHASSPAIVARRLEPPNSYAAARTTDDAARGAFVWRFQGGLMATQSAPSPPHSGARPDPGEFAVVAPGKSEKLSMRVFLLAGPSEGDLPPGITLRRGQNYVLSVGVPLWPYSFMGPERIRELRRKWASAGALATDTLSPVTLEFTIPSSSPMSCSPFMR